MTEEDKRIKPTKHFPWPTPGPSNRIGWKAFPMTVDFPADSKQSEPESEDNGKEASKS